MALSFIISEIKRFFHTRRNFAKMVSTGRTRMTRMIGLPDAEESMMLYLIQYRNVTNRQTDGQNCSINVARQHRNFGEKTDKLAPRT